MTSEHQLQQLPRKLFQVAKLVNVGKEAIVELLHRRGYTIENKPTAELTEEMLALVLEHFKKDLRAAEKSRQVLQQTTRKKAEKAPAAASTAVAEPEPPAAPEPAAPAEEPAASPIATAQLEPAAEATPALVEPPAAEPVAPEVHVAEAPPAPVEELPKVTAAEPIAAEAPPEEPSPVVAEHPITESPVEAPPTEELPPGPPAPTEPTETEEHGRRRWKTIITVDATEEAAPPEPTLQSTGLRVVGRIDLHSLEQRMRRRVRPEKPQKPERTAAASAAAPAPARPLKPSAPKPTAPAATAPTAPTPTPAKPTKPTPTKRRPTTEEPATPKVRRRRILEEISEEEIEETLRQTMIGLEEGSLRARLRQKRRAEREERRMRQAQEEAQEAQRLRVTEFITTAQLAALLGVPASEIIAKCLQLGLMVTINQRLDRDTITLIAADYGYEVEFQDVEEATELVDEPDPPESLRPRPPIVTIMGHVDHGKTTLLDYIRQSNIVAGEAGGITQHIGAYQVQLPDGRLITFLDTPGHEAFTAMRARGAQVTDIVVLVVAADDAVMPQTVEAINHARAANVPIIVAINKVDKPEANPDRIRQQLAEHGVLVEEWGGPHQCVEISALTGKNVDLLLEKILLEAELLNLRANPDRPARGTIIEAHLDRGKGPVATVIVQKGTLRPGDAFVAGAQWGRVRALYDERGNRVEAAPPATPVQVTGFDGIPEVGDQLIVVADERLAREIAQQRQQLRRQQQARQLRQITLGDISQRIQQGQAKELRLVLKADVMGSVEALVNALLRLSTEEVRVNIIHSGVGAISEADVMLAAASEAVIVGFQVEPTPAAQQLAAKEGVDIRLYRIIYECVEEIQRALEGLLSPELKEEILGHAEVRQVFQISRIGTVAGCYVTDGTIARNARVRILRDGLPIHTGTITSLKRFKEDVREVSAGYECGLMVSGFEDFRVGDVVEAFRFVEHKRTLS